MDSKDLQTLFNERARLRARSDFANHGYFSNGYPVGTPEYKAYESYANRCRCIISRCDRVLNEQPLPLAEE